MPEDNDGMLQLLELQSYLQVATSTSCYHATHRHHHTSVALPSRRQLWRASWAHGWRGLAQPKPTLH